MVNIILISMQGRGYLMHGFLPYQGGERFIRIKDRKGELAMKLQAANIYNEALIIIDNKAWEAARESARTLIQAYFWQNTHYVTGTGEGLGWVYFNYLHVASTAWTDF